MPVVLSTHIASPLQWTAETPNLYSVEVRLKRGDEVLHRYHQRFGFRTFEVREGDGLYLNGRRIVLKGADRHSCWPDSGRCLSEAVHRLDIETIKDMNMNAVRMSHYPPDAEFLDLCDELGLYVLDELAGWHNFYDTETGTKLVREMVERDVNHPSILFWDNGNEGGFNTNLDHLFGEFDPQQRHVLHPWAIHGGVNTAHYNLYEQVRAFCASNTIYMPTEFQHGLFDGGAGAGLEDYWSVMGNSHICAGGFIWALIDEGVKRPGTGQIDVAGNQAPDGIVGPYRQREGSFYTIKELWSPIQVKRETNGTFTLENHYSFTDARQCKFTWQLRGFGWPDIGQAGFKTLAEGSLDAPEIPPGDTGKLTLNLPRNWENTDALALRVEDPGGRELWTWVWPLNHLDSYRQLPDRSEGGAAHIGQTGDAIEVTAGDLKISFSKESGMLARVQRGARKFSLANGPRPAAGSARLVKMDSTMDGSDAVVTATFSGDMKNATWRIRPNGWVQCDYTYTADGPKEFFGVAFDYPESLVKSKSWLGEGPFRVWKNRLCGGTLNVWSNSYNNTITGWRDWIYPEFKGCFAGVRWLQLQTSEGAIAFLPGSTNTFVQVLTPEFPPPNTVGKTLVHLPQAGLAFLDAIPPVGSKFKDASTTGPQGQLAVGKGEYSGSVSFYFGELPQAR